MRKKSKKRVKMECPVCYEVCDKCCEYTCGHSFCYDCVRQWYQKSPTCPMCRSSMCFRGMLKLRARWDSERDRVDEVFMDSVEELFEECEPYVLMFGLKVLQGRARDIEKLGMKFTLDEIDFLLNFVFFSIKYLAGVRPMVHEMPTYIRYLMVPKTSMERLI